MMKSMKLPKRKASDNKPATCPEVGAEEYPYCLRLDLNEEVVSMLGLETLPKVGTVVSVKGLGKVVGVRQHEMKEGKTDRRVEIQIERLEVENKDSFEEGFSGEEG